MTDAIPTTPSPGVAFTPDAIPWEPPDSDGTRFAVLEGSREGESPFSYAFYIPAGFWDGPHAHTAGARVVVAKGELRLGYGRTLTKGDADRFVAGSFLHVPAGAVHFDGAEEDTIIVGSAVGPWATRYVNG